MAYVITFLIALLGAVALTPLVARFARVIGAVDVPGVRKVHKSVIPRIGGLATALATVAAVVMALVLRPSLGQAFGEVKAQLLTMLASAAVIFAVGLIDDLRPLHASIKFVALVAGATALYVAGVRIESISLPGWSALDLGVLSWPATVVWIVGVTGAINLIDGLDGLAAGISLIACAAVTVFSLYEGQVVMSVLMLAMVGSLMGFLLFNFNPARIFLGDCGSMFIGYVIASASVLCARKTGTFVALALPILALGVPLLDSVFTFIRRGILERRPIFSADRGHIHHRLLDMGLRQRHAVMLLYGVTFLAAGMGMFMIAARRTGMVVIFGSVLVLLVLLFQVVGSARLKETLASLQRNRAIARKVKQERDVFEDALLHLREASSFEDWWQAVCTAAEALEFARLSIHLPRRGGGERCLSWQRTPPPPGAWPRASVRLPIADRRSGWLARAELEFRLDGSLEAAGRRVSLFGRLMDEHSLASLPPSADSPVAQVRGAA